jgi:hypothetical protein
VTTGIKLQAVTLQLVFGRCEDRNYPLVDLTYWTRHDVLDQERLTTRSLDVCSECYGPVDRGVCLHCFATFGGEDERESWEGILLSGGKQYVATKLAEIWSRLHPHPDVVSMYIPGRISTEQDMLYAARGKFVQDTLESGNYRVYQADTLEKDLATGVPLVALLAMFLDL